MSTAEVHPQNVDPFGIDLQRPSSLTRYKLNEPGISQARRAELREQYEAEVAIEAGAAAPSKPTSKADALAGLQAERAKALAFVNQVDEALAAHTTPTREEVAGALEDGDEYGLDEDDQ